MTRIAIEGVVPAPAERALEVFWSLDELRASWPHILAFDVHYADDAHQDVSMTVERDGAEEHIRVVRFRRGDEVEFWNPIPPPAMTYHRGRWRVAPEGPARARVQIERDYDLWPRPGESDEALCARRATFEAAFRARLEAILAAVARSLSAPPRGRADTFSKCQEAP